MEIRNSEQRNAGIAFCEPNRELEPPRLEVMPKSGSKRTFFLVSWKWETESSTKVAHKIAKTLRNCEESVAKKQSQTLEN